MGEKNKKSNRKPAAPKKSASSTIKHIRKRLREQGIDVRSSLKEFASKFASDDVFKGEPSTGERSDKQLVADWLFNKRANFSTPNLCIGKTKKKKGAQKK